jgi:hypothetical protein
MDLMEQMCQKKKKNSGEGQGKMQRGRMGKGVNCVQDEKQSKGLMDLTRRDD